MSLTWFNLKKKTLYSLFFLLFVTKSVSSSPVPTFSLPSEEIQAIGEHRILKKKKKKHTLKPSFGCVWPSDEILVNVKEFYLYSIYILAIMAVLTLTTGLLPVVSNTLWILHMENSRSKESIRHQRVQFWVAWWNPHCSVAFCPGHAVFPLPFLAHLSVTSQLPQLIVCSSLL